MQVRWKEFDATEVVAKLVGRYAGKNLNPLQHEPRRETKLPFESQLLGSDNRGILTLFTTISGMNKGENVERVEGGPLDEDSMVAYQITKRDFAAHEIRATKVVVDDLQMVAARSRWNQYATPLTYANRTIDVFGSDP